MPVNTEVPVPLARMRRIDRVTKGQSRKLAILSCLLDLVATISRADEWHILSDAIPLARTARHVF